MRFFSVTLFSFILLGCTVSLSCPKKETLLLAYADFGPQVIANEIIGMEWWQWDNHGSAKPSEYNIRVVVYRNIALPEVQKRFPIDETSEADYRYLSYDTAIQYLEIKINDNVMPSVTTKLQKTRTRLLDRFDSHGS